MTSAVANSVLACDAVTNFSEATSDRVSEPRERGVGVSESIVMRVYVKSVRSDDGQMSYPSRSTRSACARRHPTPLLLDVVDTTLLSLCRV